MRIDGKLAVVTGAAVGTGRAIARRLAAEGAAVVLADIDEYGGQQTRELIGQQASFVRTDMRDDSQVEALIARGPQILVNNAGGGPNLRPCFPEAGVARWTASLDLNLRGPMLATQLALEPMRRAGGGVVINLGSTAGLGYGATRLSRVQRGQGCADPFHLHPGSVEGESQRSRQLRRTGLGGD